MILCQFHIISDFQNNLANEFSDSITFQKIILYEIL